MDSGNSGSMQSSSGGDDQEFHSSSRASDSISSFLNPQNNHTFTPQQQNFLNPFFNPQTLLDHNSFPLTNHYNTNPSNDNLINWSTTTSTTNLRSHSQPQQGYTNFTNLTTTPSSSSTQPIILPTNNTQTPFSTPRAEPEPQSYRAGPDQQLSNVIKNPKKRTRASRRAPTTVLTTDTTNFRQMVQEFTGIPAVPFSGSPYARRLDLFSSGLRPDAFGPIYPLRPAAQKYNSSTGTTPMFANTSTSILDSTTTNNNNNNSSSNQQNFSLASADELLNQFQQNQNISTLQNLMSGYHPSQERAESGQVVRSNDGNNNNNRWRNNNNNNSNDGVQENNMVVQQQQFDGNRNGGNENVQEQQQQQQHVVMSGGGYNLNVVSEKNVGDQQGNVNAASWICNSD